MKNEQDLLIFSWGTNVSRLGDLTAPQTTGRQWSHDQPACKWHSLSLADERCARGARTIRSLQQHARGTKIFQAGEHLLDQQRHTQLTDAAASLIAVRPRTLTFPSTCKTDARPSTVRAHWLGHSMEHGYSGDLCEVEGIEIRFPT